MTLPLECALGVYTILLDHTANVVETFTTATPQIEVVEVSHKRSCLSDKK